MNFFIIDSLENGVELTSYGRIGLDYNPDRDKDIPSFTSFLKTIRVIDSNLVTFGHDKYGSFQLTFGGFGDVTKFSNIEWFNFTRLYNETTKSYSFRAMIIKNIGFRNATLGSGYIQAVVDNNIPGLLYKVTDSNDIEKFRKSLSTALESAKVRTTMIGPMVSNFIIYGMDRQKID